MKLIYTADSVDLEGIAELTKRNSEKLKHVEEAVAEIIQNVKQYKDEALKKYALEFDKAEIKNIRVSEAEIEEAYNSADPKLIEVMKKARDNIAQFHSMQKFSPVVIDEGGRHLSQIVIPLARVGLYVPGGSYPYPSTVLMDSVPAICAGVKEIAMVTPCGRDGKVDKNILAAAKIAGVSEIYISGGAQAVAALAYGTESIKPVDKICGPGNVYVTTAKRMVYGDVDIDMLAGPSEVLVIADEYANARYIAADMLSQAEHDANAAAILVTDSEKLAREVKVEVEKQLKMLPTGNIAHQSIENYGTVIVTKNVQESFEVSNIMAPEHLELALKDAERYINLVKNAGTIFVGEYTPEPLGDYYAGTNHTIPTSGTARFYSPLSAYDFVKRISVVKYDREALKKVKDDVILFAETEGLYAHAESVRKRFADE